MDREVRERLSKLSEEELQAIYDLIAKYFTSKGISIEDIRKITGRTHQDYTDHEPYNLIIKSYD